MAHDIPPAIAAELNAHLYMQTRLREDFPDLDEETFADTLEGLTNLNEALGALLRSRAEDDILTSGLKTRIAEMQARLQRLQERAEKKRQLVGDVMERAGMPRLMLPDFTVSLRKSPAPVEITDEIAVPAAYWRLQPPKLDRAALGEALRSGALVAGARLGASRASIAIRTR